MEGSFRGHLPNPPAVSRDIFSYGRLLRALSNLALNVSRDGASTTSLGNLSQCFSTLIVKNFFLISGLNLPSLSVKPLFFVIFHLFCVSLNFSLYMCLFFATMHPSFPVFVSMLINGDTHNLKQETSFRSFCCF